MVCLPCDYGSYAPPPGGYAACLLCPGGVMTPTMMAVGLEACTGPDYCKSKTPVTRAFACRKIRVGEYVRLQA